MLIENCTMNEKIRGNPLVLYSDNGSPMKSFALKAKLESIGVISSFSRTRVSYESGRYCNSCRNFSREGNGNKKKTTAFILLNPVHPYWYTGYFVFN